jgi:sulfatase modifying factor 1
MRTEFPFLFILLAWLAGTHPILAQTNNSKLAHSGMALIPAGAFTMGDVLDGDKDALPIEVTVSAFYMDTNLVSYAQWSSVYNWATNHGYLFANPGEGKASNHPVQRVNWYDCVKWSNARSQQAGLTPVYYSDAALKLVYTKWELTPFVNWSANGYRLPTEAEWEKAARGGLNGRRFPWGNTISQSQANYNSTGKNDYDLGPTGYNVPFANGESPYTSPVGSFGPNGYGLYDMAGNVFQWCWDWYGTPYAGGVDPCGPALGGVRVLRGGSWYSLPFLARCSLRGSINPSYYFVYVGFRCVRRV